jgi:hypothetical protein
MIADELFDYDPSPVPFLIILMLLVGLWLPLWWAPGLAMVWTWLRSH